MRAPHAGRAIEELTAKRNALRQKHQELRAALLSAMADEYCELEIGGEKIVPAMAARRLVEHRGDFDWIPGPVSDDAEIPLTAQELRDIYILSAKVSAEDEALLRAQLPDVAKLPAPPEFATLFDDVAQLERKRLKSGQEFWLHEKQTSEMLGNLLEAIKATAEVLQTEESWLLECVDAGRGQSGEKDSWTALVQQIEECCREIPLREELILAHGPKVKPESDITELLRICRDVIAHIGDGKRLGKLSAMLKPEW